jgi:hypothetical protein
VPSGVLLARFRHYYPADVWRAAGYQTQGGVIPFGLFWIYYTAMSALHAFDRVQFARGTATAIEMSFAKKDSGLPSSLQSDLRECFLMPPE